MITSAQVVETSVNVTSPTVLLRTTLTQTITIYRIVKFIILGTRADGYKNVRKTSSTVIKLFSVGTGISVHGDDTAGILVIQYLTKGKLHCYLKLTLNFGDKA